MNESPPEKRAKAIPRSAYEAAVRPSVWNYLSLAVLGALIIWSYQGTQIHLGQLFSRDGGGQILAYIGRLYPPDFSAAVLREALRGAMETFAISFISTLMAAAIALSVVFFASRNLIYSGLLYEMEPARSWSRALRMVPHVMAKGLLNGLRTIPEFLWALIVVFIVGLGPFAGVLALASFVWMQQACSRLTWWASPAWERSTRPRCISVAIHPAAAPRPRSPGSKTEFPLRES